MDTKDENLELLDLALGELSPEAEAEVRLRVAASPAMRAELEALEEALALAARVPTETPPRSMDEAIMAAARSHVAGQSSSETEPAGPWKRVAHFLREAVNGPQAAMATITLLVVAVGLWFIPTARREPDDAVRISDATHPPPEEGVTLLEPAVEPPEPEQAATGGVIKIELEEAKRLDERKPRARKAERPQSSAGAAPAPAERSATKRVAREEQSPKSAPMRDSAETFDAAPARSRAASAPSASSAPPASAMAAEAESVAADSVGSGAANQLTDAAASRLPEAERLFRAGRFDAASALAREIIARPRGAESSALAGAYDIAARSERAMGRCEAAAPLYLKILSDYPSYPRRAAVSSELKSCK
jgi:hypothetical protein